ncbi:hypothetical protein Hamer_G024907 [Homarus americanus]|uniref:Uncharacterized protein n=1 Tax=Homarus americanus TaxID=6706 RepID=A0A8J5N9M0_HOMAM|nr:hypothetical protein Hamer_G024907 [Homarus americanus]
MYCVILSRHGMILMWKQSLSLKKCGISNSMDGMEDDMLWEDEDETEAEATSSDLEFDPYDDATINVSQDVLEELMMSHVDDVDFECF